MFFSTFRIFGGLLLLVGILSVLHIEPVKTSTILKDLFQSSNSSLTYLNGIKTISSFFVILIHTLVLRVLFPFKSGVSLKSIFSQELKTMVVPLLLSTMVVESFFVIGGILTARTLAKTYDSR